MSKIPNFSKLKQILSVGEEIADDVLKQVENILTKVDTPEKAVALKGSEREQYLKALDAAYGPRNVRAKDLGFGDETYYHGTARNFDKFSSEKLGESGRISPGYYFSNNPEVANEFAQHSGNLVNFDSYPNWNEMLKMTNGDADKIREIGKSHMQQGTQIIPVKLKTSNDSAVKELNTYDARFNKPNSSTIDRNLKSNNFALFKNSIDSPFENDNLVSTVAVVKNPNQIRSTNAAFDPRFKDSSNILAGLGAAVIGLGATLTPEEASAAGISTIAKKLGVGLEEAAKIKQLAIDKVPQSVLDDNIRAIQSISKYRKEPGAYQKIGSGLDTTVYNVDNKALKIPKTSLKEDTNIFPSIVESVGLGPKTKTIDTSLNRYQVQDLVKPMDQLEFSNIADDKLIKLQKDASDIEDVIANSQGSKILQNKLDKINKEIELHKIELAKKAGIPIDEIIKDYNNADSVRKIQYKVFGDVQNIDDINKYPQMALEGKIQADAINNLSDFVIPKDLHTGNIGLDLKNRPTIFDTSRFSDVQYQNLTPEMKQNIINNNIALPAERQLLQQRLNSSDTMKKAAAVAPGLALASDENESSLGDKLYKAGSYAGEKAMQGLHALGAPQRYMFDKAATAMDIPSNPEDSEETAFNMVEAASNKLGLPEDSTALNAAKAGVVTGLDWFADPLTAIPIGKFGKLRKLISP